MKKLILLTLSLFSLSSFAQDYTCYVSNYRLIFKADDMMSDLVVQDRLTGEYVYSGNVDTVQNFSAQLQYNFGHFKLSFEAEDIRNQEEKLFGFADGTFGRGFYNTSLRCIKD